MVLRFERRDVKTTFPSANADPVRAADNIAGNYNGNKLFCACSRALCTGGCFALPVQTVSFNRGRGKSENILGGV